MPRNVSIVIPALNEEESIGHVVASMPWTLIAECIVVDNGSTDETAAVAAAAGAKVINSPRGYGAAMSAGTRAALPSSTILVQMDGDGADSIESLPQLIGPIERGEADFVIGSRILGKRESGSMLFSQVFAGWLVSRTIRIFYGYKYTDMGPFRAMRRDVLERMQMQEMTFGWNLEMQIRAIQMNLRIVEIPVDYKRRIGGTSKVSGNIKASLQTAWRILRVFLRAREPSHASESIQRDNMARHPLIKLEHVTVARGGNIVLHDLNLVIHPGESLAILGPNGCGKSTLLKTITCECYPIALPEMSVCIMGRERWDLTELKRRMAIVGAELPSWQTLTTTGFDTILTGFFSSSTLWPHLVVTPAMCSRAEDILEHIDGQALRDRNIGEMSAGQQRRILIGARSCGGDRRCKGTSLR